MGVQHISLPFLVKSLCNVVAPTLLLLDCVCLSVCLSPSAPTSAPASQHSEDGAILYSPSDPSRVSSQTGRQRNTTTLGEGRETPGSWEKGKMNSS